MNPIIDDAGPTPGQEFDLRPPTSFGIVLELPNTELYIQTASPDDLIAHAKELRATIQQVRAACDWLEAALNRRINGRKLELADVLPEPDRMATI